MVSQPGILPFGHDIFREKIRRIALGLPCTCDKVRHAGPWVISTTLATCYAPGAESAKARSLGVGPRQGDEQTHGKDSDTDSGGRRSTVVLSPVIEIVGLFR